MIMDPLTVEISRYSPSTQDLQISADKLISSSRALLDKIGAIQLSDVTVTNVLEVRPCHFDPHCC